MYDFVETDKQLKCLTVADKTFGSALVVSTGVHITCDVPKGEAEAESEVLGTHVMHGR